MKKGPDNLRDRALFFRLDSSVFTFANMDISNVMDIHYGQMLSKDRFRIGYKILCYRGNRIHTQKRNMVMYQYGSTVGASQHPFFWNQKTMGHSMLPRPVVKSRPGNIGNLIMNNNKWFQDLCQDVELIAIRYLEEENSFSSQQIRRHTMICKRIVPACLRICNTFFTQMVVVGPEGNKEGEIPLHLDSGDYINVLVHIGDSSVEGGEIGYHDGMTKKDKGKMVLSHRFKHGRVQVGYSFDRVYHGCNPWRGGHRGVMNFSLKKCVIHHFYKYGSRYYKQFVKAGYPSKEFIAM